MSDRCKKCIYVQPVSEVYYKEKPDWAWPDDWECVLENAEFPDDSDKCVDYTLDDFFD